MPERIYLTHPESCCAWFTDSREEADRALGSDGLVMEVPREEYLKACAAWGIDPGEEETEGDNG